ncbi:MAG: BBP7 family outer membrane beta-barrel protein [Planctomycetia bacterium]|nr:BBP7 family outer membrane beta-barrel protein [Planctomycetia bacterium]
MKNHFLQGMLGCLLAATTVSAQAPLTEPPVVYYEEAPTAGGGFWGRAEFQLWSISDTPVSAPLVTISGLAGEGILGPGTAVVIGAETLDVGMRPGGRFTLGGWRDGSQSVGWEASYQFFGSSTLDRDTFLPAAGLFVLAVPYIDANTGAESSSHLSTPEPLVDVGGTDTFSGAAFLSITSRLQGGELNGVFGGYADNSFRVRWLAGFRWLQLTENLVFATSSPDVLSAGVPAAPDATFVTEDKFDALNNFYSGQFGVRAEYEANRLSLSAALKLAVGWMDQQVKVNGQTITNDFTDSTGPTTTFAGGYFALPTNIGRHNRCQFAFAPELDIQLGYRVTNSLRATMSYGFLYVSSVARPGDQIDRIINPTQAVAIAFVPGVGLTGPARPELRIQGTDFWAHVLSFGLEYSY